MPKIKPISDLRNYTEVLNEVNEGSPVYLTRNGRSEFAILIEIYNQTIVFDWRRGEVRKREKMAFSRWCNKKLIFQVYW